MFEKRKRGKINRKNVRRGQSNCRDLPIPYLTVPKEYRLCFRSRERASQFNFVALPLYLHCHIPTLTISFLANTSVSPQGLDLRLGNFTTNTFHDPPSSELRKRGETKPYRAGLGSQVWLVLCSALFVPHSDYVRTHARTYCIIDRATVSLALTHWHQQHFLSSVSQCQHVVSPCPTVRPPTEALDATQPTVRHANQPTKLELPTYVPTSPFVANRFSGSICSQSAEANQRPVSFRCFGRLVPS